MTLGQTPGSIHLWATGEQTGYDNPQGFFVTGQSIFLRTIVFRGLYNTWGIYWQRQRKRTGIQAYDVV